ncbi:hypothetical protein MRX96_005509 [Rhipicephalus microplus]
MEMARRQSSKKKGTSRFPRTDAQARPTTPPEASWLSYILAEPVARNDLIPRPLARQNTKRKNKRGITTRWKLASWQYAGPPRGLDLALSGRPPRPYMPVLLVEARRLDRGLRRRYSWTNRDGSLAIAE